MNKKIALIFIGNIEYCPYLKEYETIIQNYNFDYDVLFWEREHLTEMYPDNYHYFSLKSDLQKQKYQKILDFIKFANWLNKVLKKGNYTHLIFLDTLSGIISYLTNSIPKHAHMLLEIRDYTYEHIKIFYHIEKKLISKMDQIFISSYAFQKFLPDFQYTFTHNFNTNEYMDLCPLTSFHKKQPNETLNLVYTGSVKYFNYQKAIINSFKNDPGFHIYYHGMGPDYLKLKHYCQNENITNVTFTGLYENKQKPDFYKNADFLINCYDINLGNEIIYAISNKYYDGLIYHIPQLSECRSFKGSLVEKNNIGITWRPEDGNLKEKLLQYYYSINDDSFNQTCLKKMDHYYKEYIIYKEKIILFLKTNPYSKRKGKKVY